MKNGGGIKARLVATLTYHGYIFLASIVISIFFMWVLRAQFTSDIFIDLFPLVFIQLEIFLWMGKIFFPPSMKENMTPGKIVINTLFRLLLFYVAVFITAVAIFFISLYVRTLFQHVDFRVVLNDFMAHQWNGFIGSVSSGLLFGIILFFFFQWKDALNREQKLKEEKLLFRYETLKNQVNPHFLFNSFNTLASLVDNQPDVAGIFISKLSSLYRYILEKQDQDWVALTEELDFARNFFELQKIRDGERVNLEIDIPEPEKFLVLPISVQILLENVFKHNAASRENPLNVKISFEKGGYLLVSNPLRPKSTMNYSTGTGLRNLGERTRLIAGRDIRIIEKPSEYSVRIPLKIKMK